MATELTGRWRIDAMDLWDLDPLDLLGPAFIDIRPDGTGSFRFIAVEGSVDGRFSGTGDDRLFEFSWAGVDECDPASGRGWARPASGGSLSGRIFFHDGDDSAFHAVR